MLGGDGQFPNSIERIFQSMQEKMIGALEVMLPEGFDFSDLERLFTRQIHNQLDYGQLILDLLEYFIGTLNNNLVKMADYLVLEQQTQKLQAQIRNHIKIQQSVKIYLDIKLRSLDKYKREALQRREQVKLLYAKILEAQKTDISKSKGVTRGSTAHTTAHVPKIDLRTNDMAYNSKRQVYLDEVDDTGEALDDQVLRDLQRFRYYNRRVPTVPTS